MTFMDALTPEAIEKGAAAGNAAITSGEVFWLPSDFVFTAEYLAESRDRPAWVAIICLLVFTTVIVGARCFSRAFIVKKFGVDDGLCLLSLVLFIVYVVFALEFIKHGGGRHTDAIQWVLTNDENNFTQTMDFWAHMLYTATLYFCRMSALAFFYILCKQHSSLPLILKGGAAFVTSAFLTQFFILVFHCLPVTTLSPWGWQPEYKSEHYKCMLWSTVYLIHSALSLVSDFFIFTIPIFLIASVRVSKRQKFQLAAVLCPGIIVVVISAVRVYLVVQGQYASDTAWFYDPLYVVEAAEIAGTLIALSIPGLKPLLGKWISGLDSTTYGSRTTAGQTYGTQSFRLTVGSRVTRTRVTKLGSGIDDEIAPGRHRDIRPGDSDDSLVDKTDLKGDGIQVRTSLHVESGSKAGSESHTEPYAKTWDRNHIV